MQRTSVLTASLLAGAALAGGVRLAAQAVERSDVPERGVLRVTFDPRIMTWNSVFTDMGRLGLGRGLTGDSVGAASIPTVARVQQDVRLASGVAGFVASLGQGVLSVRQERRTYPVTAQVGLTHRLSVSLMVPFVRVATRTGLQLSGQNANLGLNPKLRDPSYAAQFFGQFQAALDTLNHRIAIGMYGCVGSQPCAARDSAAYWKMVHDALDRLVNGVGKTGQPFLPRDSSDGGKGIVSTLTKIQNDMKSVFADSAFTAALLLPSGTVDATLMQAVMLDSATGFGYRAFPFRNSYRLNLGDVELAAKYRFASSARYAAAAEALVRLPTGATDSADDWLRQSIGDHVLGLEGRLQQEVTVGPLWLNIAVRGGAQLPGTRVVRVAPWDVLMVPFAATMAMRWHPGSYLGVDVAPLVRLAPQFAVGVTAGYWTKARDHYSFESPQDSTDLALRLGGPTPASVLDPGTSQRWLRLGIAVSYVAATVEGGFSIEQTVTGAGVAPAATVYRIVLRTSRKLF